MSNLVVNRGDFNIWISRYYSGEMSISIILIFFFIGLALYLKYEQNDENFWKIFLFSSICWIGVELFMQGVGNRTWANPPHIFGISIFYPLTAFIQGIAEGGIPIVSGYFCTKLYTKENYSWLTVFLGFLIVNIMLQFILSPIALELSVSHRALSVGNFIFILGGTALAFYIIWRYFKDPKFAFLTYGFICILGLIFNFGMYFTGQRGVEYAVPFIVNLSPLYFHPHNPFIILLGLLYDALFEIAGIYLTFYVISAKLFKAEELPE